MQKKLHSDHTPSYSFFHQVWYHGFHGFYGLGIKGKDISFLSDGV